MGHRILQDRKITEPAFRRCQSRYKSEIHLRKLNEHVEERHWKKLKDEAKQRTTRAPTIYARSNLIIFTRTELNATIYHVPTKHGRARKIITNSDEKTSSNPATQCKLNEENI